MRTSDFDYELPPEYIAQSPIEPRHDARLLVLSRKSGEIKHAIFHEVEKFISPRDLLVLNETRVIPGRLYARKIPTGGRVELLLIKRRDPLTWEALVGGKGLTEAKRFEVESGPQGEVVQLLAGSQRVVRFYEPIEPFLKVAGHVPLPPYIHTPLKDPERYQTIYSRTLGSAAAPTAGLHFTTQLINALEMQGVRTVKITLHIGLDTFAPVKEENPRNHEIHSEWVRISLDAAAKINNARKNGGKVIAVGTTSVRSLESAAVTKPQGGIVHPYEGSTDLFILPGYQFKVVDGMITNFHLPRSTLIMLVSAFCGRERILNSYEVAKKEGYRFYSFGDAMLII
ncbi:MAG: tRNA preQ1(34) S-adenosylmethionine ribosyltransferase-isomerase QueA [Anaerolineales bacterium]|nr:tRNA preQ1(34) S-adenosylmethionine ribosyltransferase-isomerase QueA [Anaerolineales bacterium]